MPVNQPNLSIESPQTEKDFSDNLSDLRSQHAQKKGELRLLELTIMSQQKQLQNLFISQQQQGKVQK